MLLLREQQDASLAEAIRRAGLDNLQGAFDFSGGQDLDKPGLGCRRRTRLHLTDSTGADHLLYMKRYNAMDRAGLVRARLSGQRQGSQAWLEMRNIQAVRDAGVPTMQVLAWGQQPPRSYILVTSVPGEAVERCGNAFFARYGQDMTVCDAFTWQLANMASRLHQAGLFHRDFYASHVFLEIRDELPHLYLIDLARIIAPRFRRFRWVVKDLAQLKYSMPDRWVNGYWEGFLQRYLEHPSGPGLRRLQRAIDRKVQRMTRHDVRRRARRIKGSPSL